MKAGIFHYKIDERPTPLCTLPFKEFNINYPKFSVLMHLKFEIRLGMPLKN